MGHWIVIDSILNYECEKRKTRFTASLITSPQLVIRPKLNAKHDTLYPSNLKISKNIRYLLQITKN